MSDLEPSSLQSIPISQAASLGWRSEFGSARIASANTRNEEIGRLAYALVRRWKFILPVMLVTSGVVASGLQYATPTYVATAEILIDVGQAEYSDLAEISGTRRPTILPSEMETFMKVLWSDRLAKDVVETIGPGSFSPVKSTWASMRSWADGSLSPSFDSIFSKLLLSLPFIQKDELLSLSAEPPRSANVTIQGSELYRAIAVFQESLEVSRDPLAAVITVSYRAADAVLATEIANAAALAFSKELVRVQKESLAASAEYLGARVAALSAEIEADDSKALDLRRKLSDFGDGSLTQRRYGELLRSLSDSEAELVAKRNDTERSTGRVPGSSIQLDDPVLADLKRQEMQISNRIAEMGIDLQSRHPAVLVAKAEQVDIGRRIKAEEARIKEKQQAALAVDELKVGWIRKELSGIEVQLASDMSDQLALRQLTARTDSTRLLYQELLTRYQRAREQQLMVRTPARVINAARIPGSPESRRQWIVIAATALGSFACAAGLVLVAELRRVGYLSVDDVLRDTGLPAIGSLPAIDASFWKSPSSAVDGRVQRRVYGEAIRRAGMRLWPPSRIASPVADVLLVTSAMAGDGKTVVALSMARQLAHQGLKVLVVEGDLHKRSLKDQLQHLNPPDENLVSILADSTHAHNKNVDPALTHDARYGVDFILAGQPTEDPHRLLGSEHMRKLLKFLAPRYDVILIDSPPILAVSDAMAILPAVDKVVFVVRWDATARSAVKIALREISSLSKKPIELLFNAVDLHTYSRYTKNDHLAHYKLSASYVQ